MRSNISAAGNAVQVIVTKDGQEDGQEEGC